MSADGGLLGREGIESLLAELGRRCANKGIAAEMFMVGGGAMALAYSRERVTRDLDAIFVPKMLVYAEARQMADELNLPPDWLNDGVKGLMPDRRDDASRVQFVSDGLTVMVASPEYMFAMKALSARQESDTEDLLVLAKELGVTRAEQAFAIAEKYYAPHRLSAKSAFFIEQTFAEPDPGTAEPEVPGPADLNLTDLSTPQHRPAGGGRGSNQYRRKPKR